MKLGFRFVLFFRHFSSMIQVGLANMKMFNPNSLGAYALIFPVLICLLNLKNQLIQKKITWFFFFELTGSCPYKSHIDFRVAILELQEGEIGSYSVQTVPNQDKKSAVWVKYLCEAWRERNTMHHPHGLPFLPKTDIPSAIDTVHYCRPRTDKNATKRLELNGDRESQACNVSPESDWFWPFGREDITILLQHCDFFVALLSFISPCAGREPAARKRQNPVEDECPSGF